MDELKEDIAAFKRAFYLLLGLALIIIGYDVYQLATGHLDQVMPFYPVGLLAIAAIIWYGKRHFEKLSKEQRQRVLRDAERRSFLNNTTRNVS